MIRGVWVITVIVRDCRRRMRPVIFVELFFRFVTFDVFFGLRDFLVMYVCVYVSECVCGPSPPGWLEGVMGFDLFESFEARSGKIRLCLFVCLFV